MKGIVFCLLGLLIGVESSGQLVRRKDYDLAVALQAGGGTSVGIPDVCCAGRWIEDDYSFYPEMVFGYGSQLCRPSVR